MATAPTAPSAGQQGLYASSAGLDLVSGVFGFLSSMEAASAASSRADMIRAEANANAQRYSEQAVAHSAQTKTMFLASGVTLAGSPLAVLDSQARIAKENYDSILQGGQTEALDAEQRGTAAEMRGRDALVGGFAGASKALTKGFGTGFGGGMG